jgi:glycosyltransferase involved in cell wall biosynthesis
VLVYHMALGSGVADFVAARSETLVVDHHNITPAGYFEVWDPAVVQGIAWGRRQLAMLASRSRLGLADSTYNRAELDDLGYGETAVAPILFNPADLEVGVEAAAVERLRSDGTVWLYVSRFAPNKCQHDLVTAFSVYRRVYDPGAVLRLIGRAGPTAYVDAIRGLVRELGLGDSVELLGAVDAPTLGAHYRAADVFVSASEHEGFAVPLLEAMHHDLPVVAYSAGAVPETLASAGLCLPVKDPGTVAAAVHRVVSDGALRGALVDAGRRRLAELSLESARRTMAERLRPVVEEAAQTRGSR